MIIPDFDTFQQLARAGAVIPVYRELLADMETPLGIYARFADSPCSFLLESVEGGENLARYSFIGADPWMVFQSKDRNITITTRNGGTEQFSVPDSPFEELRRRMNAFTAVKLPGLPRFTGGAVGYISYDAVRFFEDIPQNNPDDLDLPELYFVLTKSLVVFDHVQHKLLVVANACCDGRPVREVYDEARETLARIENILMQPMPFRPIEPLNTAALTALDHKNPPSNFSPDEFAAVVERCKEYIRAGDIIQVVPSQRFEFPTSASPLNLYRALRCVNPSPYMFLLNFNDMALVGSSPEVMVRVEDRDIELRPIAGTRRRGLAEEEDRALEAELLADDKERAEHVMLVDLGRNDVGRVSEFNSVHVPELMIIERYSHVMHIVSDVRGTLLPGKDVFDVLAATFPAGTVSGAPKIRAMQIIDEMEKCRRGPYAGTVCYLGYDSNLDSCITIRTIVMKNGTAYVQAGAGIVADSKPELEYQETVNKARGMIKAIKLAEQIN